MGKNDSSGLLINPPDRLKFSVFVLLIVIGILLEFVVHYIYHIAIIYTEFYYLIVIFAGIWYRKVVIGIAIFFGGLQIVDSLIMAPGSIPYYAITRAVILVVVACVIWIIMEELARYYDVVAAQNKQLYEMNNTLVTTNAQLEKSEKSLIAANKKLNLLSTITRHDIKNQLAVLLPYISITRMLTEDPELIKTFDKEETVANIILEQISFTADYEEIGVKSATWQNVEEILKKSESGLQFGSINMKFNCSGLDVYADPLLEKVFYNLMENSLKYGGEKLTFITIFSQQKGEDYQILYEDDGTGISTDDKKYLFRKGFGRHTGLGLFLSREILSITGITINETGVPENGVRLEITVPKGQWKLSEHHQ